MLARGLAQPLDVDPVVVVVEENSLPVIAALNDMDRHAGKEETSLAGHGNPPGFGQMRASITQ